MENYFFFSPQSKKKGGTQPKPHHHSFRTWSVAIPTFAVSDTVRDTREWRGVPQGVPRGVPAEKPCEVSQGGSPTPRAAGVEQEGEPQSIAYLLAGTFGIRYSGGGNTGFLGITAQCHNGWLIIGLAGKEAAPQRS